MQKHVTASDGWWHERPTKAADLQTSFQTLPSRRAKRDNVWKEAGLIIGLMFGLILSLIALATR